MRCLFACVHISATYGKKCVQSAKLLSLINITKGFDYNLKKFVNIKRKVFLGHSMMVIQSCYRRTLFKMPESQIANLRLVTNAGVSGRYRS